MEKRTISTGEEVWIAAHEGVDGRTYWCVMVHRPGSPFVCTQGEHLSREAAETDATENWQ